MQKKTLYLLRHAQSEYNKLGIIQGDVDTPLSKEGRDEVKKMAHVFESFELRQIVHSPLARATQTAELINEVLKLPISGKENLKEMDFGKWSANQKIEYWDQFRRKFYEFGDPPPDGESKNELFKRVETAVHEICMEFDEDPILIAAHGMVNRILMGKWFTNNTEKEIRELEMENLALYKIEVEYDGERVLPVSMKYIDIYKL